MTPLERQVLDALPITVCAVDLDGRITFVNRSSSRATPSNGAPHVIGDRAKVGASVTDVITDFAVRARLEQAMAAVREGRTTSLAWEVSSGTSADAHVHLLQLGALVEKNAVTGYVLSAVDVTQSHRARAALIDTGTALARTVSEDRVLQEVSQLLRRAMSCDAVVIAYAEHGSEALQLAHQSGFSLDDTPKLSHRFASAWEQALASGEVVTRESADGVEITAPMRSGDVRGAITLTASEAPAAHRRDESHRLFAKIAGETAAAVERAWEVRRMGHKRRLEAISEVSAGVAHELRNPLFGISSAAQLLRFRVKDDPVVEKNVGRILREVERLNSMVTSLLEYGRPGPMRLEPGDPDAVWDEVIESNRGQLESRALLLQRSRTATPARCAIDAPQLAQALVSLFVNAADAAPEGSDLSLQTSVLPGGAWRCRLRNGGAPIAPDALPRVFELFFSTKPGGAGIGLPLCQRIIEEHGGTVSLESSEIGTAATVVLPGLTV